MGYKFNSLLKIERQSMASRTTLGRFIQPDSIIPDLTNSQAWNRYSYVANNPLKYIDPTGHIIEEPRNPLPCIDGICGSSQQKSKNVRHPNRFDPWKGFRIYPDDPFQFGMTAEDMFLMVYSDVLPGHFRTTTLFGNDNTLGGEGYHMGVDIDYTTGDSDRGEPILAGWAGVVVYIESSGALDFGRMAIVEVGIFGVKFYTIFAHMEELSVDVGDRVSSKTKVGTLGDSPDPSMSVHLHLEVRKINGLYSNSTGEFSGFPRHADAWWADTKEEAWSKWVNISLLFGGYAYSYPTDWRDYP